jgi:hypothetical protein
MRLILFVVLLGTLLFSGCGGSKKSTPVVTVNNEFTNQFPDIEVPISIADTSLDKALGSVKPLKISGSKYFPDSLVQSFFGKGEKITLYPIGKVQNEDQEIYVLMKGIGINKKAAFILCYDNQLHYKDGALICKTDGDAKTSYRAMITKNFDIKILKSELVPNGEPILTESYLAYNNAGFLGEVVTNDSDDELDLTNPIDTLPQTKKYSGDYFLDKKNFVSLRDSKDSGELIFFYHYEKAKQDCSGEIKDKIHLTGNATAAYMRDGDPCVMNIQFNGNQLILKEDHGCGNKRPMDCTLDGVFVKRLVKPASKKTDTKTPAAKPGTNTKPLPGTKVPVTNKPVPKPLPKPAPKTVTPKKPPVKQPEIQ